MLLGIKIKPSYCLWQNIIPLAESLVNDISINYFGALQYFTVLQAAQETVVSVFYVQR